MKGRKFDLAEKESKVNLRSSFEKTVDLESSKLYTKIQPKSFLGSGEEVLKVFLSYVGMAASLLDGAEQVELIGNTLLTRGSM